MFELKQYQTTTGRVVFNEWLVSLKDTRTEARVAARVNRILSGNFGDCKPVGGGVSELRLDFGPGYRVYYAVIGNTIVLLLCGGDKRRQSADIAKAVAYLKDYHERSKTK